MVVYACMSIPALKMRIGSNTIFTRFPISVHFSGVIVSPLPLKMPTDTNKTVAAGEPKALHFRYLEAACLIGVPEAYPIRESVGSVRAKKQNIWIKPIMTAVRIAEDTESDKSFPSRPATKLVLVFISGSLYTFATVY